MSEVQFLTVYWFMPDECTIKDAATNQPVMWLGAYKNGSIDIELPNGETFEIDKKSMDDLLKWILCNRESSDESVTR